MAGQVWIRVRGGVVPAPGCLRHRGEDGAGGALLAAGRFHVRDHRQRDRLLMPIATVSSMPAFELKFDSGVTRSWFGEIRPRVAGDVDDLDHFLGIRKVRRLVVETGRHAPRALAQPVRNQRAHARDLVGGRASIGVADDVDPGGVEADVAADVHRETGHGQRAHLLRDVERSAAVGVEDLGGHALREHVDRGRQRIRRRMTMNVDEAGRHEQAARIDVRGRGGVVQVADRGDEAVLDRRRPRRSAGCRCRRSPCRCG